MSSVSVWIMSLIGVCVLSVVVDLVVPSGKMSSSIKNVFSYIVILVVLAPLPKLINGNFSFDGLFSNVDMEIQDQYIYNINQAKLDKWTITIETELENTGIKGATVSISANIFENDMQVDAVYVDLYNAVISSNLSNKNIQTEVISVVLKCLDVEKSKVVVYE